LGAIETIEIIEELMEIGPNEVFDKVIELLGSLLKNSLKSWEMAIEYSW